MVTMGPQPHTWLTEPPFKKRVAGHKNDIKYHNPGSDEHKAGTRLSRHCGGMKLKGIPYTIEWSILKRTNGAFNPRRNFCQLCCMEKYLIMFNPDDATLNLRSEFFAHCRHKDRHLLTKSWYFQNFLCNLLSMLFSLLVLQLWPNH